MIDINPEDQYAICSGNTTLIELEAALPLGLQYRAPRLPITLEDWLLSGGIGILTMPPVRKDILGLTYTAAHGTISLGGTVVKNVAGYDAVRLVIGSDPSLTRRVRIQSATLRLRPRVPVVRLESQAEPDFTQLLALKAAYAIAYQKNQQWTLHAEFWGTQPNWGQISTTDLEPNLEMYDTQGIFPRVKHELSALEARVLNAL